MNKAVFLVLYHVQAPFHTGAMPERQTSLRRIAAEPARILCACGLDALRQYTPRTGMNNLYGGGISVAWLCLHAA